MQRLMALDVGTKRIGVAIGDDLGIVIKGQEALLRKPQEKAILKIKEMADMYNINTIIVGLPLHVNGDFSQQAQDCKEFAALLEKDYNVIFEDERYTSFEAEQNLLERGIKYTKNKHLVDIESACIILNQYVNKLKGNVKNE